MARFKVPFFKKKANSWDRKSIFVGVTLLACLLVIIATLITVASLANYIGSNNELVYHPEDVINLNSDVNDFNAFLCSQYSVDAVSCQADMYLLPEKGVVKPQKAKNRTETIRHINPNHKLIKRSYTFLPGSTIDVSACVDRGPPFEMFLIKGDNNFKLWKVNRKCSSCVWRKKIVDLNTNCSNNNSATLKGHVTEKDTYHLVIRHAGIHEHLQTMCTVNIHTSRSRYDVTHATEKCASRSTCVFSLAYDTHPEIIVDFTNASDSSTPVSLKTYCRKRTSVWLGLLFMLPASLIVLIILCMIRLYYSPNCRNTTKEKFVTIVLDQF